MKRLLAKLSPLLVVTLLASCSGDVMSDPEKDMQEHVDRVLKLVNTDNRYDPSCKTTSRDCKKELQDKLYQAQLVLEPYRVDIAKLELIKQQLAEKNGQKPKIDNLILKDPSPRVLHSELPSSKTTTLGFFDPSAVESKIREVEALYVKTKKVVDEDNLTKDDKEVTKEVPDGFIANVFASNCQVDYTGPAANMPTKPEIDATCGEELSRYLAKMRGSLKTPYGEDASPSENDKKVHERELAKEYARFSNMLRKIKGAVYMTSAEVKSLTDYAPNDDVQTANLGKTAKDVTDVIDEIIDELTDEDDKIDAGTKFTKDCKVNASLSPDPRNGKACANQVVAFVKEHKTGSLYVHGFSKSEEILTAIEKLMNEKTKVTPKKVDGIK